MIRAFIAFLALWAVPAFAHDYQMTVERFIDADTFDGQAAILPGIIIDGRFRLMCINAPESRGSRKSPEGVAMSELVKSLGITSGTIEIVKKDAFGRFLVHFRPEGWDQSLNRFLFRNGAPLYGRLTRAERADCEVRVQ